MLRNISVCSKGCSAPTKDAIASLQIFVFENVFEVLSCLGQLLRPCATNLSSLVHPPHINLTFSGRSQTKAKGLTFLGVVFSIC